MKPAATIPSALPARPSTPGVELAFPPRATVRTLRALRERHYRQARYDLALQVALEVARRDPGRESFFKAGFHHREVGRYREALKCFRDALRFTAGPEYLVPQIHLHTAFTWLKMGQGKRAAEAVKRAYALRPKPRIAFNFHMTYGAWLLSHKRYPEAIEEYEQALRAAGTALHRGSALTNLGIVLHREVRLEEARVPLDRAVGMLKRAGHLAALAVARSVRAAVHFDEGQYSRAMGMYLRAADAYRRMGIVDREAEALVNATYAAGELGLWTRVGALADRTISLASATGQYRVLAPAYALRATACAYDEDYSEAAKNLERSARLMRGRRDWIATLHLCRARARVAMLQGRWNELFRAARQGERLASKVGDLPRVAEFRRLKGAAEERQGRRRAAHQARTSAARVQALVKGSSPSVRKMTAVAAKLAKSELPLVILGDSATGCLELARRIHEFSPRSKAPCSVVACEHLSFPASDLNGHVEGAWSGAAKTSMGQIARAAGGTVILDRVDELAPEGQRVLLGIADGRLRPVGSAEERAIDVRLVATCSRLDALIPELRHRLAGAVLRLPALKDRAGEIVKAVHERLAGRRRITPDALAELSRHPWQGDLSEVRATVDRLVTMSEGPIGRYLVRSLFKTPETRRVAGSVNTRRHSLLAASSAR